LEKIHYANQDAIKCFTTNTNDTALHCYTLSIKTIQEINHNKLQEAIDFLTEKHDDALITKNTSGFYPIHLAAKQNLSINFLFKLAVQQPMSIIPNNNI